MLIKISEKRFVVAYAKERGVKYSEAIELLKENSASSGPARVHLFYGTDAENVSRQIANTVSVRKTVLVTDAEPPYIISTTKLQTNELNKIKSGLEYAVAVIGYDTREDAVRFFEESMREQNPTVETHVASTYFAYIYGVNMSEGSRAVMTYPYPPLNTVYALMSAETDINLPELCKTVTGGLLQDKQTAAYVDFDIAKMQKETRAIYKARSMSGFEFEIITPEVIEKTLIDSDTVPIYKASRLLGAEWWNDLAVVKAVLTHVTSKYDYVILNLGSSLDFIHPNLGYAKESVVLSHDGHNLDMWQIGLANSDVQYLPVSNKMWDRDARQVRKLLGI